MADKKKASLWGFVLWLSAGIGAVQTLLSRGKFVYEHRSWVGLGLEYIGAVGLILLIIAGLPLYLSERLDWWDEADAQKFSSAAALLAAPFVAIGVWFIVPTGDEGFTNVTRLAGAIIVLLTLAVTYVNVSDKAGR